MPSKSTQMSVNPNHYLEPCLMHRSIFCFTIPRVGGQARFSRESRPPGMNFRWNSEAYECPGAYKFEKIPADFLLLKTEQKLKSVFSDGHLLYFYRFCFIPCFETIFYFCFSISATNSPIHIFEESEKSGGRARFRSEIPGGRTRLLGRPEGRETFFSECPGGW